MSPVELMSLGALALLVPVALWIALRLGGLERRIAESQAAVPTLERLERLERELRDELSRTLAATRQELSQQMSQQSAQLQQTLIAQNGDALRTQNEQIDALRVQVGQLQQGLGQGLQQTTQGLTQSLAQQALAAREAQDGASARLGTLLTEQLQLLSQRNEAGLAETRRSVEQRLAQVQTQVDQRLVAIQQDNEKKLEQMRATVDEKLHATLEQRLGESFKQVAERLEQVHKGLGEMQGLARDVGSLNRVLTNVKTRGIFGEVQLAALLEQVFTPEQYASNVATVPGSAERVEFAIALPGPKGRDDASHAPLWLPIDAKFPREDYERLLEAQERGDPAAAETAAKAIETRLRLEARSIRDKYVAPPHTTDFGILFVPTEGLYAEALRRPGLVESLQREHKVMLAGPTTLLATLNSLQMGFRTLALEKRSAEVWEVLSAVKTEFGKFGEVLAKTKKKLDEASNVIEQAETRTRQMSRKLKTVEALPDEQSQRLLGLGEKAEAGRADADAGAELE
ncbi:DNA recombination protein RmuC [Pelomonas sp. CA6]|uniref:DNA recombination protein RmuC n=1 Tax=Pelomonas sp. CA6 TaxID=2907999 RepID=UPI001F4BE092|nr:DNA recombination protein RmuC [Pelomonas sp. CA6]MCH7343854.1 DNA recombination protein RmuC [Pelomonas sp. CA6]